MYTFRLSEYGKYADDTNKLQAYRLANGFETGGPVYHGYNKIGKWVINPAAETVSVMIPKGYFHTGTDSQRAGGFVTTLTESPEQHDECLKQIVGIVAAILDK